MGYDAFISYSHAADDLTAGVLQDALQRFAKPWYRRRGLHVFLDQRGLSVNPGLWTSITDVMDEAGWFVLLASPEAATSVWVNREIEYWLEHRDRSRLLPVLTDGSWSWNRDAVDFDWSSSTAVPPALGGAFAEEPRHVDMRWARDEPSLSRRMPRLLDQVVEIAAPIHGVDKDEIQGQDLREHRRTIRIARLAAVILVFLTIAATAGAFLAVDNARQAERARDQSDFERVVAQARVLGSSNRELAALLAVEARHQHDNPQSQGAMQSALVADARALGTRFDPAGGAGYVRICVVDDGRVVLTAGRDGAVGFTELAGTAPPTHIALAAGPVACRRNADGAVYVFSLAGQVWPVDASSRSLGAPFEVGAPLNDLSVSPDGRWLAAGTTAGQALVWPADHSAPPLPFGSGTTDVGVGFSEDGNVLAATADDEIVIRDASTWAETRRIQDPVLSQSGGLVRLHEPARHLNFAGDGVLIESRRGTVRGFDLASGTVQWQQTNTFDTAAPTAVSADSVVVATDLKDGIVLLDVASGAQAAPGLATGEAFGQSFDFTPDGKTFVTGSFGRPAVSQWSADGRALIGRFVATTYHAQPFYSASGQSVISMDQDNGPVGPTAVFDTATGSKVAAVPPAAYPTLLDDHTVSGFFVDELAVDRIDLTSGRRIGPKFGIDRLDQVFSAEPARSGRALIAYDDDTIARYEADGTRVDPWLRVSGSLNSLSVSPAGDLAAVVSGTVLTVYSVETGLPVFPSVSHAAGGWFSADGRTIGVVTSDNHVVILDTETGRPVGPAIPSGAGAPVVNMGGSHFIVARNTGGQLYDDATSSPIGEPFPSEGYPALRSDGRQLVTSNPNGLMLWDLDPDHWEQAACVLAGRNLTRDEWKTYFPNVGSYHATCPQWPSS